LTSTFTTGDQPRLEDPITRDRKYKVFWAVFLVELALTIWGKLDGDQFVELTSVVFGLYMAGNVGEHWTRRDNSWRKGRW